MKNTKKLPTKQLEKFSNIFTQLGLVLVLFIVYITLEHQTEQETIAVFKPDKTDAVYFDPTTEIIFTKEPKAKPKQEVVKQVFLPDEPIVKGDKTDSEIIFKEPKEVPFDIEKIIEVKEPVIFKPEDVVPYVFLQNAPVFKGCENLTKEENKRCFDKKMKQFVQRNFNVELANELGLHSGKHKIQTQFIINKEGNVIDVKIRAPHKSLKKETQRIINKLPKFKPGKQNNKSVQVRYTLPIAFSVE